MHFVYIISYNERNINIKWRLVIRSVLSRKLKDIRYRHGNEAVSHFLSFPYCQCCGEDRIVCLSLHHVHGKHTNEFETLCHNCHAIYHAHNSGHTTYSDEQKRIEKQNKEKENREDRNRKIYDLYKKDFTLKEVGKLFGISESQVSRIVKKKKYDQEDTLE